VLKRERLVASPLQRLFCPDRERRLREPEPARPEGLISAPADLFDVDADRCERLGLGSCLVGADPRLLQQADGLPAPCTRAHSVVTKDLVAQPLIYTGQPEQEVFCADEVVAANGAW
jgi:hypothetical protein